MVKKIKKVTKAFLLKKEKKKIKKEFKEKLKTWRDNIIQRDKAYCQKCNKALLTQPKNVHHLISLQNVKRKYPALLEDTNNGILLCSFCHKFAPDSPHQGSLEFVIWLMKTRPTQYDYLKTYIENNND